MQEKEMLHVPNKSWILKKKRSINYMLVMIVFPSVNMLFKLSAN